MRDLRRVDVLLLGLVLTGQSACGGAKVTGPAAHRLEIVTDLGVGYVLQTTVPQPQVRLVDVDGNPVARAGVVVTATISWGDVKVVAGGTATTGGDGIARFSGLTFGALNANSGEFEVTYTSPGLVGASETEAITCRLGTLSPNAQIIADLLDGDCLFGGSRYRYYDESFAGTSARTAIRVSQTAAAYAPAMYARKRHDFDRSFFGFASDVTGTISYKILVPEGQDVRFMPSTTLPDKFGPFTVGFTVAPEHESGCEPVVVFFAMNTQQSLEVDCTDDVGNIGDYFYFLLESGRALSVTMTTSNFTPYVSVWAAGENNARIVHNTATGNTATLTFRNTGAFGEIFYIFAGSSTGTGIGTYQLTAGEVPFAVQSRIAGPEGRPKLVSTVFKRGGGGPR